MSPERRFEPEVALRVLQGEQQMLRSELGQLKSCQLQYFALSVTGTAALAGLAAMQKGNAELLGIAFLAPLAIVLPCWWIFFDKATTITRVVGYYRVIERMLGDEYPYSGINYIGYERALALYRKEEDGDGRSRMEKCQVVRELREAHAPTSDAPTRSSSPPSVRHGYWQVNWWTYFWLSILCCLLSAAYLLAGGVQWWFGVFPSAGLGVVAWFARKTARLKGKVMKGEYTYDENHYFWEYIHSPECMERSKLVPNQQFQQTAASGGRS